MKKRLLSLLLALLMLASLLPVTALAAGKTPMEEFTEFMQSITAPTLNTIFTDETEIHYHVVSASVGGVEFTSDDLEYIPELDLLSLVSSEFDSAYSPEVLSFTKTSKEVTVTYRRWPDAGGPEYNWNTDQYEGYLNGVIKFKDFGYKNIPKRIEQYITSPKLDGSYWYGEYEDGVIAYERNTLLPELITAPLRYRGTLIKETDGSGTLNLDLSLLLSPSRMVIDETITGLTQTMGDDFWGVIGNGKRRIVIDQTGTKIFDTSGDEPVEIPLTDDSKATTLDETIGAPTTMEGADLSLFDEEGLAELKELFGGVEFYNDDGLYNFFITSTSYAEGYKDKPGHNLGYWFRIVKPDENGFIRYIYDTMTFGVALKLDDICVSFLPALAAASEAIYGAAGIYATDPDVSAVITAAMNDIEQLTDTEDLYGLSSAELEEAVAAAISSVEARTAQAVEDINALVQPLRLADARNAAKAAIEAANEKYPHQEYAESLIAGLDDMDLESLEKLAENADEMFARYDLLNGFRGAVVDQLTALEAEPSVIAAVQAKLAVAGSEDDIAAILAEAVIEVSDSTGKDVKEAFNSAIDFAAGDSDDEEIAKLVADAKNAMALEPDDSKKAEIMKQAIADISKRQQLVDSMAAASEAIADAAGDVEEQSDEVKALLADYEAQIKNATDKETVNALKKEAVKAINAQIQLEETAESSIDALEKATRGSDSPAVKKLLDDAKAAIAKAKADGDLDKVLEIRNTVMQDITEQLVTDTATASSVADIEKAAGDEGERSQAVQNIVDEAEKALAEPGLSMDEVLEIRNNAMDEIKLVQTKETALEAFSEAFPGVTDPSILGLIFSAEEQIGAAKSAAEITELLTGAVVNITNALLLKDAKTRAVDAIEAAASESEDQNVLEIAKSAEARILASGSAEEIASIMGTALEDIRSTESLASSKATAVGMLLIAAKDDESPAMKAIIANAEDRINAAETETEVNMARAAALNQIKSQLITDGAEGAVTGGEGSKGLLGFFESIFNARSAGNQATEAFLSMIMGLIAPLLNVLRDFFGRA